MKKGDLVRFEGALGLVKSIEILVEIIDDKHKDFPKGTQVTVCEEEEEEKG